MSLRVVGMCGFVGVLLCCCCDLTAWCSSPPSRCLFWIPSALFCDAGIRRLWLFRPGGFELPPFSWRLSRSVVGIVAGAWGIDHVSVGCVPHRATGVRPERPAGAGGLSISPYEARHDFVEAVVVGFASVEPALLFVAFECECVAEFRVAGLAAADCSCGGLVALLD